MNEVIDLILRRKSVRHFTGKKICAEHLDIIIRAGMSAPSAVNLQPWEFLVVNDDLLLQQLSDALPYSKMAINAGTVIIVLGMPEKQFGGKDKDYWLADCSAVTQNILLAVESLDLGAVWTAVYPEKDRIKKVQKLLNIPKQIIPLNIIPVGYPSETDIPKHKYEKSKIHFNGF